MSSNKRRRLYEGFGVLDQENSETIVEQPSNNSKTAEGFSAIVGLQRKILDYFFLKAQSLGSRETGKIQTEVLAEMLACTVETVRTSVQRLEKKGFIKRLEYKSGRGGFSVFKIDSKAFQELAIENNSKTILKQNSNSSKTEPKTEPKTDVVNSSRDIEISLIPIIQEIQIPTVLKSIISKKEISDLLNNGHLSETELRESLEHFAYDLENNFVKSKGHPINLFFGLSRSGKKYRSLKLLEQQNSELRDYQKDLMKLEYEEMQLKEAALKVKFREFIGKNPNYLEETRTANPMVSTDETIEKLAFSQWKEQQ